jgi:hypothetical protein
MCEEKVLVLTKCEADGSHGNNFKFPKSGFIKCPDKNSEEKFGNEVYGLLWGEGVFDINSYGNYYVIIECDHQGVEFLWNTQCKIKYGEVIHFGDRENAIKLIKDRKPYGKVWYDNFYSDTNYVIYGAGRHSKLTAGEYCLLSAGDYSTLTAGDNSRLFAGNNSFLTAGDNSSIEAICNSKLAAGSLSRLFAHHDSTLFAGSQSTLDAGNNSFLTAGDYSTLRSLSDSRLFAGDYSILKAGDYSILKAGIHSTLIAGDYSRLFAGNNSSLTAGLSSIIECIYNEYNYQTVIDKDSANKTIKFVNGKFI